MSDPFPAVFREFLALFNRGAYWESHEVLEVPWREHRSDFYKGLILLASAYVHVQRANPRGIAAQFRKAERCLEPFRPAYLGLDVRALVAHAARCRILAEEHAASAPGSWAELIPPPEIWPSPALLRGDEPELARR